MDVCKGSILLGTACGKCLKCAEERERLPDGYYFAQPRAVAEGESEWVILRLEDGNFWQIGSDAAVGPWHIGKVKEMTDYALMHQRMKLLLQDVMKLRYAQQAYMRDRGNDVLGLEVGKASARVDAAIVEGLKSIPEAKTF